MNALTPITQMQQSVSGHTHTHISSLPSTHVNKEYRKIKENLQPEKAILSEEYCGVKQSFKGSKSHEYDYQSFSDTKCKKYTV